MWRHLYWRIWLTVVVSAALGVAVGMALAHYSFNRMAEREPPHWLERSPTTDFPPASAGMEQTQAALDAASRRLGFGLLLRDANNRLITRSTPLPASEHAHRPPPGRQIWVLPDGRHIVNEHQSQRELPLEPILGLIALIAATVALGSYPIVRRLTRRLEVLRASVVSLGAGDLKARVPVQGNDEVAQLAMALNRAAERIEALVRAQRSLLANASHELRSPLARMRMGLELLNDAAPGERRVRLLAELTLCVRELDELIEEILTASALDAGSNQHAMERVDLSAIVLDECRKTGAACRADSVFLTGDSRLLRRLVRNLLENAQKYGQGKTIDVHLDHQADTVALQVLDRGPGVAEQDRERIFEPFYRKQGASEAQGGVGLGLALVRQIALHHQGNVQCLPREGGGSCFVVNLPVG
jgi:signal transduction histidine kinase